MSCNCSLKAVPLNTFLNTFAYNRETPLADALRYQIEVQRKLHEQLEVTNYFQSKHHQHEPQLVIFPILASNNIFLFNP